MGRALAALRRRPPKAKRAPGEAAFRRLVSQSFPPTSPLPPLARGPRSKNAA